MTSNYRRGADLERAARAVLEDNGYEVIRSAGSKSPVDLVAIKQGEILFVQCKTDGYLRPAEIAALRRLALLVNRGRAVSCGWHKEGRAARVPAFTLWTSGGPAGAHKWTPDHGFEVAS